MATVRETERLTVRELTPGDVDALFAICGDAELMRYVGDGRPLAREECERWVEISLANYARQGFGNFAVVEKATGEMVGYCGLVRSPEHEDIEIIYGFLAKAAGKGYATEAAAAVLDAGLTRFGLERVVATIDPANAPSLRIAGKLGMRFWKEERDKDGFAVRFYAKERE
jgi:RimJ/RimL family protein N-acetyltransferase